jgi:hypothetical protein
MTHSILKTHSTIQSRTSASGYLCSFYINQMEWKTRNLYGPAVIWLPTTVVWFDLNSAAACGAWWLGLAWCLAAGRQRYYMVKKWRKLVAVASVGDFSWASLQFWTTFFRETSPNVGVPTDMNWWADGWLTCRWILEGRFDVQAFDFCKGQRERRELQMAIVLGNEMYRWVVWVWTRVTYLMTWCPLWWYLSLMAFSARSQIL